MSDDAPILSYASPTKRTTGRFAILPCALAFIIASTVPPYVLTHVADLANLYHAFGLRLSLPAQILVDYSYWYASHGGWIWIACAAIGLGFAYPAIIRRPLPTNHYRTAAVILLALVLVLIQLLYAQRFLGTDAIKLVLRNFGGAAN